MNKVIDLKTYKKKEKEENEIEKEYQEFIQLLQYYVDIQEPKYNIINVYLNSDSYHLCKDENGKDITTEFLNEFKVDENASNDDILVSSLVRIAPRKIFINNSNNINPQVLKTLSDVFFG